MSRSRPARLPTTLAVLAFTLAGVGRAEENRRATWSTFVASADPAFTRHPAHLFEGRRARPVFGAADALARRYPSAITSDAREGVNFAGDQAIVAIGCGSGCASAFDVDLRNGAVRTLPFARQANDLDLQHRADSRYLKVLYRRVRGREERCIGQAYVWTDGHLQPAGPELSRPVNGHVCPGFDAPAR